ncbi:MAG: antitoxin [Nocardioidaceae bacterium]|nr:antitoxin [Nocardioidaceae bacterium]
MASGYEVSVSLPQDDIVFLDAYAESVGMSSRSAVVHKAVALLRAGELIDADEDAWRSWSSSDDAVAWDSASADGMQA